MTSFAQWLKGKDLGLFNQFPRYFVQTSCIVVHMLIEREKMQLFSGQIGNF